MAFKDKLSKFFGFSKKDDTEDIKNEIIEEEAQVDELQTDSADADDAARIEAEEAQRLAEEKAKAEEAARKAMEEQAKAEAARKAMEEQAKAEAEAARKAMEEQAKAEAEAARKAMEEQAKAEAEAARKAMEDQAKAEAEAARKAMEEQAKAEAEAARKAMEEQAKAEEEAQRASEEVKSETEEEFVSEQPAPKKGFFAKLKDGLTKTRDSINSKIDGVLSAFKKVDEELFEELEEALIMADVGVDTSLYIIGELRKKVKENKISETDQVKGAIEEIISELLCKNDNEINVSTNPAVIMVIGVNGVGKTTSIGKMAARYKAEGKKVILGAADTFRAAAIDQLQVWADRSGVEIIKHQEGSDPASVVFDTIAAAKARGSDLIILDTAGRLHNKKNLMDELAKISRIIERELPQSSVETLLVLDATTGQNAVNQSKLFSEAASISGLILTKLDGSAKGGIVLAISHEQNIPVKLVGVGEGIDDLQDFVPEDFAKALFS